jgi:hypothetical protein
MPVHDVLKTFPVKMRWSPDSNASPPNDMSSVYKVFRSTKSPKFAQSPTLPEHSTRALYPSTPTQALYPSTLSKHSAKALCRSKSCKVHLAHTFFVGAYIPSEELSRCLAHNQFRRQHSSLRQSVLVKHSEKKFDSSRPHFVPRLPDCRHRRSYELC